MHYAWKMSQKELLCDNIGFLGLAVFRTGLCVIGTAY